VVLTGAGISTPSGIPDFRSPGSGLWENTDPFKVISLSAFHADPELFYEWLHPLAVRMRAALPNPAHTALARLEVGGFIQAVMTQNIDGLHQKAGSKDVLELHGSLDTMSCLKCGRRELSAPFWEPLLEGRRLPQCPGCGAVLKPDIVFFEELLPAETWERSERLCSGAGLILVVGSSLGVVPANQLPVIACRNGARLAIFNREPTPLDGLAEWVFAANAEEVLPRLLDCLEAEDS